MRSLTIGAAGDVAKADAVAVAGVDGEYKLIKNEYLLGKMNELADALSRTPNV